MKKKGFTLVELLAVIVILSIIAVIAVPQILKIITVARKEAFSASIKNIKDSIRQNLIKNNLNSGFIKDLKMSNLSNLSGMWYYNYDTKKIDLFDVSDGQFYYSTSPVNGEKVQEISSSEYTKEVKIPNNQIFSGSGSSRGNWESRASMGLGSNCGIDNGTCLIINGNNTNVDAYYQYTKTGLIPNYPYIVEAYIKGENIESFQSSNAIGALIAGQTWDFSDSNKGTFDYKKNQYVAISNKYGNLTFRLRLGYTSSTVKGNAYFDKVRILPYNDLLVSSRHVRLLIDDTELNNIDKKYLYNWLFDLDKYIDNLCYITDVDCNNMGYDINGRNISNYWGEASGIEGNLYYLIHWNRQYVSGMLNRMKYPNNVELSFGIMHEIGHKFAHKNWNWHGEFWANMNMSLGLYNIPKGFVENGKTYVGDNSSGLYNPINLKYCSNTNCTITNHDTFNSYMIKIQQDIGIEIFKKTFQDLKKLSGIQVPTTNNGKLELFMQTLFDNYNAAHPGENKSKDDYFTSENWQNALNYFKEKIL